MIACISSVVASRICWASLLETLVAPRRANSRWGIAAILSERAQALDLLLAQPSIRAWGEPVQSQRTERDSLKREHGMTDRLAHAPDLPVATLVDRQLDQIRLHTTHARRRGETILQLNPVA